MLLFMVEQVSLLCGWGGLEQTNADTRGTRREEGRSKGREEFMFKLF